MVHRMTRSRRASLFIAKAGWADASVSILAGDASNRRYDRLTRADGATAVLMDAPTEKGEDVKPFLTVARHLTSCGLSAPRILHTDTDAGFLLIEDLGDRLFAREMASDPTCQSQLYRAAADVLTQLHKTTPPELAAYDAATTTPLAALAYDWYQLGANGACNDHEKRAFAEALHPILAAFDADLDVLIQRDFHAENLLWLPERQGIARVGLLDFQDAMLGHPAYDLVSILQDARRDVSASLADEIKQYFIQQNAYDPSAFDAAYAVFGLQRNLRILGVFARLCMRDGKPTYVDLIPRVWDHIYTNLRHPDLAHIAPMLTSSLPTPTPEVCAQLKEKAGQWAGR